MCRLPRAAPGLPGSTDARSQDRTILQDGSHGERPGGPARRPHQDVHPARHQGLAALPARWTTADARGHRRVLQSRDGAQAHIRREGLLGRLHARDLKEMNMSKYRLSLAVAALVGAGISTVYAADPKA